MNKTIIPDGLLYKENQDYQEYIALKRDYVSAAFFGFGLLLSFGLCYYAFIYCIVGLPFLYHTLRHLLSKTRIRIYNDKFTIKDGFLIFQKRASYQFKEIKKVVPIRMPKSGSGPIGPALITELSGQLGKHSIGRRGLPAIKIIGKNINKTFGKKITAKHSLFFSVILNKRIKSVNTEVLLRS